MQLGKDVLRALSAVVWADGSVGAAEAAALIAMADATGLSASELDDVRALLATPTKLDDRPLALEPDRAEFVFSLACVLSASDARVVPEERAVLAALGDRLGLSPEARERAATASLAIAKGIGVGSDPQRQALSGLAASVTDRDVATRSFFAVQQTEHTTTLGPCALPILYRDAGHFGMFFRADLAAARALLADTMVEPWPVLGAAVVAIYVWDYRDSSIGTYGEVGLGIQCRRRNTAPSLARLVTDMGAQDDQGIWVASLPVTSEGARAAGVELWGYPKYVTTITTQFDDAGATARLGDELEVSIGSLGGPRLGAQPIVTYTGRDGRLLRTRIDVAHRVRWGRGAAKLTILGDGPTTDKLRALGIDSQQALAAFRAEGFRAKLPAGVDLGPLRG